MLFFFVFFSFFLIYTFSWQVLNKVGGLPMQKFDFNKVAKGLQLYWKETPGQIFSYEYCEIFKNTYVEEHLWTVASVNSI